MIRPLHTWERQRTSYWFVPALMLAAGIGLAAGMLAIDRNSHLGPVLIPWFTAGGEEGARMLLSSVAGAVIIVAGVTFSITMLTLTQASSQFGPRMLRNFMRDAGNQAVLGTLVATFAYSLLVRRSIGGDRQEQVPHLAVAVALLLALARMAALIFYIHNVSSSIQAPLVAADVWDDLDSAIRRMYPEGLGHERPPSRPGGSASRLPEAFDRESIAVTSAGTGYLQLVDVHRLMEVATSNDLRLKLLCRPGHFITRGNALLLAWPPDAVTVEVIGRLRKTFVLGPQRTPEQDVEFAVRQLVEIAVRALSPGTNDPFTAATCVDWLGDALCRIAEGGLHSPRRHDDAGMLRVVADVSDFAGVVDAFDQIRQYGRDSVAVTVRLLEAIATVAGHLKAESQRNPLRRQAETIAHDASEALDSEKDRADVVDRYERAIAALDAGPDPKANALARHRAGKEDAARVRPARSVGSATGERPVRRSQSHRGAG
ncbi:DUF2254 domain-containing protein [Tautonia plasticadhaerens]|nr:DUF2254 domain-containing protein [Tautonia plasticadhaerens]